MGRPLLFVAVGLLLLCTTCASASFKSTGNTINRYDYDDVDGDLQKFVQSKLASMTLKEKIGQMTQVL